jgi:hypothetical protein
LHFLTVFYTVCFRLRSQTADLYLGAEAAAVGPRLQADSSVGMGRKSGWLRQARFRRPK